MNFEEILYLIRSNEKTDEGEIELFVDDLADCIYEIDLSLNQRNDLITAFLELIENQPDPEFVSWSLVHFLEWIDEDGNSDYKRLLLSSAKKKPKNMTLLLMNRLINGNETCSELVNSLLETLKEIANNPIVDNQIRAEAKEYVEYQKSK
jgi:hypothetical protein